MATAQELLIRVLGDGSQFRRDLSEDQGEVNRLVERMDSIHDVLATVRVDDEESRTRVRELQDDLDRIRDRTARVDVDTREGREEITQIRADLAELRDRTVDIHVNDADAILAINSVRADLDSLTDRTVNVRTETSGNAENGAGEGMGLLGATIMSVLPLASPLAATAVGGIMALASAFTVASAGAVGFGAVAVPNIKTVTDATSNLKKAQDEYNLATNDKQREAALLKEKQAMQGLDSAQQGAVKSLQSFESFWSDFVKSFQTPVLNMFSDGLNTLQTLLTNLKPTISAAASAFEGLLKSFQQSLGTPPVQAFFNYLAQDAGPTITTFGNIAGNVLKGVMNLLVDFGPLGQQMAGGLEKLSQDFEKWTESVGKSQGFKEFISYVQENGPKIITIVENVGKSLGNILVALAPLGATILKVLEPFSKWLAEFTKAHPILLQIIAAVLVSVGTFNLLKGPLQFLAGFGKVVEVFNALKTAMLEVSLAEKAVAVGEALMEAANPVGWIALIIAAIVGLALLIVSHWDQIVKVTKEAWNAVKNFLVDTWNAIKNETSKIWEAIKSFFAKWGLDLLGALLGPIGILAVEMYKHWDAISKETSAIWNRIVNFLKSIWNDIVKSVDTVGKGFQNVWSGIQSVTSKVWQTIVTILRTYWNMILTVFSTIIVFIDQLVSGHWNRLGEVFADGARKMWEVIKSGWDQIAKIWGINTQAVINTVVDWFNSVVSWFEKLPERLSNAAQSAWKTVSSAFMSGVNTVINTVTNWYNNVVDWFEKLPGRAFNAASNVWKTTSSAFSSGVSTVESTVTGWYNNVISWFERLPGNVANAARNMWSSIQSAFNSGVSSSVNTVSNMVSSIGRFFANLPSQARAWGSNMIDGFIGGITSMIGRVQNAASSIVNAAKKFIGFNSPSEEGEGQHIVEWGENMIGGFIDGIQNAVPRLKDVMSNVIASPNLAVNTNVGNMITGNSGYGGNSTNPNSSGQPSYSYSQQGPLVHIENLQVRNDKDIDKINRAIFNAHESVVRGMGKRL